MKPCLFACWALCGSLGLVTGVYAQTQGLASPTPLADSSAAEPSRSSALAPDGDVPELLAQQRQALSAQREAILSVYEKQKRVCWQKFAVNACLIEARRERRQALEPIQKQELALNAQERLWRTEQRDRRLQNKLPDNKDQP